MMTTAAIILCGLLCLIAFFVTFRLGATQSNQNNEAYTQSRKKSIILLSMIYLVATIIGILFVYLL
ncbi:hypothetical protein [Laceyella sacchari]|jgi:hypothetical protein|uniref:Uncharacterized protein n=1 Tax=Laceyella sacchari TaxID=37482 RepID=A0ABY5U2V9_LACSH|nr:hypothetical protein [Laceyella sacchari]TCW39045.1 hypothetical protein EDC32_102286 [Laceyella sacchari]UWE03355.1 hypothetical protein NYR52_14770 [Laceyella sacchari]